MTTESVVYMYCLFSLQVLLTAAGL